MDYFSSAPFIILEFSSCPSAHSFLVRAIHRDSGNLAFLVEVACLPCKHLTTTQLRQTRGKLQITVFIRHLAIKNLFLATNLLTRFQGLSTAF